MTAPHLSPYGERGLLLDAIDSAAVIAWAAALLQADLPGVIDIVPAAQSVLLHLATSAQPQRIRAIVAEMQLSGEDPGAGEAPLTIGVAYDGPDLGLVAELTGLEPVEVVRRHTASEWQVAFMGFAPGFGYLVGGDPRLTVPRREVPRTRVPSGAVALAAGYSAVYPRESPGGWQLIGRTPDVMWDLERDPPALLRPGRRVRFVEVHG